MKKIIALLLPVLLLLSFSSCQKYVDDYRTKGTLSPNQSINYRYLLDNTTTFENSVTLVDFSSDDVQYADIAQETALSTATFYLPYYNAYLWADQYYDPTVSDSDWTRLYNLIFNCNTVIGEVPASSGNDADKNELIAEALVHRADAYLELVNMYGPAYNASSATKDLAVPLVVTVSSNQKLYRNTVQDIYDQIFSDLTIALPNLPVTNSYNTLPSKPAAYALLARAYLMTGNYSQAQKNAESALALQNTLIDLNNYKAGQAYPKRTLDPEIILSKKAATAAGTSTSAPNILRLSDNLLNLLGTKDLRYVIFTQPATQAAAGYTGRISWKEKLTSENRNLGPSVPEMMLIRAEGLARSGDATNAIAVLNQLRKKRFASTDYITYTPTTSQDALNKVLDERRRELFCHGYRWFDQKRLNNDPQYAQTITRIFLGQTYTLAPNSNRYLYPLATYLFQYNPYLIQNPR